MFAEFQQSIAIQLPVSKTQDPRPKNVIVALQMRGNMICVLNLMAAASVVNLSGSEGQIIRYTLGVMLYYGRSAGLGAANHWILVRVKRFE